MNVVRILYRGSLSSCNYHCGYCPFAKTVNTRQQLRQDAQEVDRFVEWAAGGNRAMAILFTPWGEAIVHAHYRRAMVRLSRMPHVQRVALQTNLSCGLQEFEEADRDALAFWATFHPTQVSLPQFVERCGVLDRMRIRYSVGVVGLREHIDAIEELRRRLPPSIYVWINCNKREPHYYSEEELSRLRRVDPYLDLNRRDYPSRGEACRAGESVFTVDGEGDVRRCHFIDQQLGNIYRDDIFARLGARMCSNATCGCHIGYVHRPALDLYRLFGDNVLERIPADWPHVEAGFVAAEARETRDGSYR
ncbi:MAG: STM4011 family radical SAM protein [Pirellulaceae bacterium]